MGGYTCRYFGMGRGEGGVKFLTKFGGFSKKQKMCIKRSKVDILIIGRKQWFDREGGGGLEIFPYEGRASPSPHTW